MKRNCNLKNHTSTWLSRRSFNIPTGLSTSASTTTALFAIYLGAVHCFTTTTTTTNPTRQRFSSFITSTSRETTFVPTVLPQITPTVTTSIIGKSSHQKKYRHYSHNTRTSSNNIVTMTAADSSQEGSGETSSLLKLVDVDCNLISDDLIGLMNGDDKDDLLDIPDLLKILHHPSTIHANIGAMLSPSSTLSESQKMVDTLTNCDETHLNGILIGTTVGVHPYHVEEEGFPSEEKIQQMETLLLSSSHRQSSQTGVIKCIGECGLDYSTGFPDKEYQLPWFEAQIRLAMKYQMPLFIHTRLAFQNTLEVLDKCSAENESTSLPPIIIHCFTGTYAECQEYVQRGYHISISGYILKNGSDEVRKCLIDGIIPLDKLMIETDAPYMGFATCRDDFYHASGDTFQSLSNKKRKKLLKNIYPNVPSALPLVLKAVLDLINEGRIKRNTEGINDENIKLMTLDELTDITSKNSHSFFGFKNNTK